MDCKGLPPAYDPGLPHQDGFQNVELGSMNATRRRDIHALPPTTAEDFNLKFFKPNKRARRRYYIIAIVALLILLTVIASFFIAKFVDQHKHKQEPITPTTTPVAVTVTSRPSATTVEKTITSVSTATPTLTTVLETTMMSTLFEITALPPSAGPSK